MSISIAHIVDNLFGISANDLLDVHVLVKTILVVHLAHIERRIMLKTILKIIIWIVVFSFTTTLAKTSLPAAIGIIAATTAILCFKNVK